MAKAEQERERAEYWWNETGLMDAAVEAVARTPFIDAQALCGGPGGGDEECGRGEQWPRQGRFLYEERGPSYYTRIPPPPLLLESYYMALLAAATRAFGPAVRYKN